MRTAKKILSDLTEQAAQSDRKQTAEIAKYIASLLEKLEITVEDLNKDPEEKEFYYRTSRDKSLLLHVAAKVIGMESLDYRADPAKNHLYFEVDPLEEADIRRLFKAYKAALESDIEALEQEFYQENGLNQMEIRRDYDEVLMDVQMMEGIDKQLNIEEG